MFRLDKITLEGQCRFAMSQGRVRPWWPFRHSGRQVLAKEIDWRHNWYLWRGRSSTWINPHRLGERHLALEADQIVGLYRRLRKVFEDGKDEPGAADFYYGEMEMRRKSAMPLGERALLHAYWALSDYGLRASRALSWLALAMIGTVLALMLWGLPTQPATTTSIGTLTGRQVMLTSRASELLVSGSWHQRLTADRTGTAVKVSIGSTVLPTSTRPLLRPAPTRR